MPRTSESAHPSSWRSAGAPLIAAAALAAAVIAPSPAAADLRVDFIESAPKDRFVIRNEGACGLGAATLEIDLAPSRGQLILDTTSAGAGVEVFQPFILVQGADHVAESSLVSDGDTLVTITLTDLGVGDVVAFTVDVDDTLPASALGQIRVTGAEIAGAVARLSHGDGATVEAAFGDDARALAPVAACLS